MSKHKILLLAPSFGHKGGVIDFCKMLFDNFSSDFHADHLRVGNLPENESFIKRLFYLSYTVYKLITKLKNGSYDIVHLNPSFKTYSLPRDSLYLSIINRLGYGDKTVVFFHGWDYNLAEKIINNSFCKNIFGKIYKKVGVIFVLYNYCKEQLINMGIEPQKIKITTTMYERIDEIEESSSKKKDDKVNILFMSRLVEGKGVYITTKVAKLLIENGYNDFHLTIAGDGPLLPGLKKFITENGLSEYVDTPGYVKGKEKEEILTKGDIFLYPTWLKEGCPVAIIEAMGAGQAVVSTPRGAIPEIVKDGVNGFICDSRNPDLFFKTVKKLLDNQELLNKMQKTNKRKAEENYEDSVYTRRMEETYLRRISIAKK